MTQIVDHDEIERIVGADRHPTLHRGRAMSAVQTVFIIHSIECLATGLDLRTCDYSVALDRGIDLADWVEDMPVTLEIRGGRLIGDRPVGSTHG